jgi:hypothetical protein
MMTIGENINLANGKAI